MDPAVPRTAASRTARRPFRSEAQRGDSEGPDQIELLLHAEGPQVQDRRLGFERGEIALPGEGEMPVRHVQEGGQSVGAQPCPLRRLGQRRGVDGDGRQQEQQRRQQPPGPAGPEPAQVDAPGAMALREQQRGDEQAAEHEEGVDPEAPAGHPGDSGVVEHDGKDGTGPEPVQRRDVAQQRLRRLAGPRWLAVLPVACLTVLCLTLLWPLWCRPLAGRGNDDRRRPHPRAAHGEAVTAGLRRRTSSRFQVTISRSHGILTTGFAQRG